MQTITIPEGFPIKLQITISSDAFVVTNIRLKNAITSSKLYKFTRDLGNITELQDSKMTIASNFYVEDDNIDQIFNNTLVNFKILYNGLSQDLDVELKKRTSDFFTAYSYVKLIKQ